MGERLSCYERKQESLQYPDVIWSLMKWSGASTMPASSFSRFKDNRYVGTVFTRIALVRVKFVLVYPTNYHISFNQQLNICL